MNLVVMMGLCCHNSQEKALGLDILIVTNI